jgi:hypothetical protein
MDELLSMDELSSTEDKIEETEVDMLVDGVTVIDEHLKVEVPYDGPLMKVARTE